MKKKLCQIGREMWKVKWIYLFLLPGLLWFGVFRYQPMYGLLMAFKKFNARLGVLGSPWVGLKHFQRMFITPDSISALINTFFISVERLIFEFPFPIFVAIMLNEMRGTKLKKIYQTVFTFPHFLSWVIIATILKTLMGNSGAINELVAMLGGERINFLADLSLAKPVLYITSIWKEAGWSAILYIAAISGISPEYYEAAVVDGASRLQRIIYITLPSILSTIVVMFLLQVGNIMNAGFDQVFNIRNDAIRGVIDILDTYVYDITFKAVPDYGFSTAVGLFKSLINVVLLLGTNALVQKVSGEGLFK